MEEHPPKRTNSESLETPPKLACNPLNQTNGPEFLKHLMQPDDTFTDVRFAALTISPDGGVSVTGAHIEYNPERMRCCWCRTDFANQAMLDKHKAEWFRGCYVCGAHIVGVCSGKHQSHLFGCDKCKECFSCAKSMMQHYKRKGHRKCYWKGCKSPYATGSWHPSAIQVHMRFHRS
jgi:hypothetical protein